MSEAAEENYQQAEAYLDQRQIRRYKRNLRKRRETCHHRAIHPLHDDDDNLSLLHSF